MSTRAYQFGSWLIEPELNRITSGELERHLEPLSMDILEHLLENPNRTVSADELLEVVWSNRIVEQNAVPRVINQIRRALGDDSRHPRYIETIRKRGYRAIAPVSAPQLSQETWHSHEQQSPIPSITPSDQPHRSLRTRHVVVLCSIVALSVMGLALYRQSDTGEAQSATEPSETSPEPVRVLPFGQIPASMTLGLLPFTVTGDDQPLSQFAEVVQVDLQAALGETEIPITSAALAQFVVEGNLRRISESIRLSILVQRQHDERIMWSHQLDLPDADLSEFKRAPFVARSIEAVLAFILDAKNSTTDNDMARDEYYNGHLAIGGWGPNWPAALGHFERAVEIDPEYADAWEMIAIGYASPGLGIPAEMALQPAHAAARKVLQLQPDFTTGLAMVNVRLDLDYEAGIRNFDHVRRTGRFGIGEAETWQCVAYYAWGDVEQALRHCHSAVSRGVVHVQNEALHHLGLVHLAAGQYKEARNAFARAVDSWGGNPLGLMVLEATAALRQGDTAPASDLLATVFETTDARSRYRFAELLAKVGRTDEAKAVLLQAEVDFDRRRLPPVRFGQVFFAYHALGDLDRAFTWLNRIIDAREYYSIGLLKSAPYLEEFRADSRFGDAMARLRDIESRGSPTQSVATRCMGVPRDKPPKEPLVSCAFAELGR